MRAAGVLSLSLLAECAGRAVGQVAFSPVRIAGASGWYGLGPLAVAPAWRRRGIGAALVREGLARLRAQGAAGCVVLGEPQYYGRFGFRGGTALRYPGPPPRFFQALALNGAPLPEGEVAFDPAFGS